MSEEQKIRVGSRKSELALIQTRHVISLLKNLYPEKEFEIVTMNTLGDKVLDIPLPKIGEKSLFTQELEVALKTGCVDFVVHSLKDLPTALPDGMAIGAVLEREDPRDALVLHKDLDGSSLDALPKGSVVGTSSLRRAAQLAKKYPHLKVESVRGNLNTRLRKLDELGQYQALILAAAGLIRMNWNSRISKILDCHELLYAVGQGALAVECRESDTKTIELLRPLYDLKTALQIITERSFLRTLGGGCSAPVAVQTELISLERNNLKIEFSGAVWSLDGKDEIIENDQCVFELKEPFKCGICPYGNKKQSAMNSSCTNALSKDIECIDQCLFLKYSTNPNTEKVSETNPNKKQKIGDAKDIPTDLLKNDPHDHCPVDFPVGADFMGKCPYLEYGSVNLNTRKCPVNGQILTTNSEEVTKCPFLKDGYMNVLSSPTVRDDPLKSTSSQADECTNRESKLYCGLVPYFGVSETLLEKAQTLGEKVAEKLLAKGAGEVMAKAQAHVRATSGKQ